jgi:hypothetical protein
MMKAIGAAVSLVLSLAAAGCGENPVPTLPTYEHDIKPLMEAECIRCHGAGGTMNADPEIPSTNRLKGAPLFGDFTHLHDRKVSPGAGQEDVTVVGLLHYTGASGLASMKLYLAAPMPPPPADPLTDWQRKLLLTWAENPIYDANTP